MNEKQQKDYSKNAKSSKWWMILLAHHYREDFDHCYTLRTKKRDYYLCARCLGLYPAVFITMSFVFSGVFRLSPGRSYDLLTLGCGIGVLEWGIVRLGFWEGNNFLRTFTGVIMGIGMGIGLPPYFRRPFSPDFWTVVGVLGGTVGLIEIVARFVFSGEHK